MCIRDSYGASKVGTELVAFLDDDVVLDDDNIFIGYYAQKDYGKQITARTNKKAIKLIKNHFSSKNVIPLELIKSPHLPSSNALHLDCCFQPIGERKAIICPDSFVDKSDVDYLESLNEIKDKCKAYRITVSELTSELKNNLAAPQGAFEKYDRTVERFTINLKASSTFLNFGKLLDDLFESGFMLNSMKINRITSSKVSGYFTFYNYISKPLKSSDVLNINFDKVIRNTPTASNDIAYGSLNWGKNIFLKPKK